MQQVLLIKCFLNVQWGTSTQDKRSNLWWKTRNHGLAGLLSICVYSCASFCLMVTTVCDSFSSGSDRECNCTALHRNHSWMSKWEVCLSITSNDLSQQVSHTLKHRFGKKNAKLGNVGYGLQEELIIFHGKQLLTSHFKNSHASLPIPFHKTHCANWIGSTPCRFFSGCRRKYIYLVLNAAIWQHTNKRTEERNGTNTRKPFWQSFQE